MEHYLEQNMPQFFSNETAIYQEWSFEEDQSKPNKIDIDKFRSTIWTGIRSSWFQKLFRIVKSISTNGYPEIREVLEKS